MISQDYPPKELLRVGQMRQYRPDLIDMIMTRLRPQYVRLGLLSQSFEGKTELTEQWYKSAYNARKIDPSLIEKWSAVEPIPELHLPLPNEFIPTDFAIVPKPEGEELPKTPVLIRVGLFVLSVCLFAYSLFGSGYLMMMQGGHHFLR